MNINDERYDDGYYHIAKDVEKYPDATVYIVWSKRGPGKTYSALRYPYIKGFKTLYMKRTNIDVETICTYSGDIDFDPSPWKPLNRDFGTNVKPRLIDKKKGIGAFYDADDEGNPVGPVRSYIMSLNAVKTVKGMDLSEVEWIIFDEFIPQPGEVVKRLEGEMLLSLYETVNRDRRKRGRSGLKLILFANAEEISTPITNTLEVVDDMADMEASGTDIYYNEARHILLHHISEEECPMSDAEKQDMYSVMQGTKWAAKSYEGKFANNDFSNIVKMSIKNMRCLYKIMYGTSTSYIYMNPKNGMYYMTSIPGKYIQAYDLNKENQQKRFWMEQYLDLRERCIDDKFKFQKYSYYDLIINYTKIFDI